VVAAPSDAGADASTGVARDNATLIDGAAPVVGAGEHAGSRRQSATPSPAHQLEARGFYPAPNFLFVHTCLQTREDCKRERDLSDFQRVKDSSERDSTSNIYSFIDENAHSNFTQSQQYGVEPSWATHRQTSIFTNN